MRIRKAAVMLAAPSDRRTMRLTKRLGASAAAVSLAAAGLVGVGSTAAHAASSCGEIDTRYGARVEMCANEVSPYDVQMTYNVIQRGSTDERFWFQVTSSCGANQGAEGSTYDLFSDNDYQKTYDTFEKWCGTPGFNVYVYATESGNHTGGGFSLI